MGMPAIRTKTQEQLTSEWDAIASARDRQLRSGTDASYSRVLQPWITANLGNPSRVLDVGCGTGVLTEQLRGLGIDAIGIDPSLASIELAYQHDPDGLYHASTLEDWVDEHPNENFDLVVANMVLMDVVDLPAFCAAAGRIGSHGRMLATITHPAFWPLYWGYGREGSFSYTEELLVEALFRTASLQYDVPTTHFHRPISRYVSALTAGGWNIRRLDELRGPERVQEFGFPRFLCIEVTR